MLGVGHVAPRGEVFEELSRRVRQHWQPKAAPQHTPPGSQQLCMSGICSNSAFREL